MKLLKNGFAFAIALLTISLTIAAHAGAFEAKAKNTLQTTCDWDVAKTGPLDLPIRKTTCLQVDPCPTAIPAAQLYGITSPDYGTFECPPDDDIFCCAILTGNPVNCNAFTNVRQVQSYLCGLPEIE